MDGAPLPPILQRAYDIQKRARTFIMQRDQGRALDNEAVAEWMFDRHELAASPITEPLDGLALAHHLLQDISVLHRIADDPVALNMMATDMAAAAMGIIRFFEECTGVTRDDVGLFNDYGPVAN